MISYVDLASQSWIFHRTRSVLDRTLFSPDVGARTSAAFNVDEKSDELYEPMFMNAATKEHKKEADVWCFVPIVLPKR